jgi:hypothetical protein
MTAAKPQTIAAELSGRINDLVLAGGFYRSADEFAIRALFKDAEALARADAVAASRIKATIHLLCGNWADVQHWCNNARQLGDHARADLTEFIAAANLGYFLHAAALYPVAVALERNTLGSHLSAGLICGTLIALIERAEIADRAKLELSDKVRTEVMLAKDACQVLERLGLPEQDLIAILEVAGEVMRERRVFWSNLLPSVIVVNTEDDVGLLYQFVLPVEPEEAAQLSDTVIERIVTRNLDKPGISFSFVASDVH